MNVFAFNKQYICVGLVSALCQDAWNSLEPGEEFEIPFRPMIWSVDAIDKSTLKVLLKSVLVIFFISQKLLHFGYFFRQYCLMNLLYSVNFCLNSAHLFC